MLCLSTPSRKGWLRAAAAEMRREGSRVNIWSIRSSGASGILLQGKGKEGGRAEGGSAIVRVLHNGVRMSGKAAAPICQSLHYYRKLTQQTPP